MYRARRRDAWLAEMALNREGPISANTDTNKRAPGRGAVRRTRTRASGRAGSTGDVMYGVPALQLRAAQTARHSAFQSHYLGRSLLRFELTLIYI